MPCPFSPSTLLIRYITMKRKHLILLTTLSLFTFSALPGCGCGAVQTSEPIQTETVTVEPETASQAENETQKESVQAIESESSEMVETETLELESTTITEEESTNEIEAETTVQETKPAVQETESEVAGEAPSQTQTESQAPAETVPTPVPQETVPVDSLTEAQQKVVDQINQGQQQTGGTPVDNGGSAEADALLGGAPTGATDLPPVSGDLEISNGTGVGLEAAD